MKSIFCTYFYCAHNLHVLLLILQLWLYITASFTYKKALLHVKHVHILACWHYHFVNKPLHDKDATSPDCSICSGYSIWATLPFTRKSNTFYNVSNYTLTILLPFLNWWWVLLLSLFYIIWKNCMTVSFNMKLILWICLPFCSLKRKGYHGIFDKEAPKVFKIMHEVQTEFSHFIGV